MTTRYINLLFMCFILIYNTIIIYWHLAFTVTAVD